jgi:hypothetical protein
MSEPAAPGGADPVLERAETRSQTALGILSELDLPALWQRRGGAPCVVGAVAYGLVVAADLDLEVFFPHDPTVEDGFAVLAVCARSSRVVKARFSNHLTDADQGLYWQLRLRGPDGAEWKVDMWSMRCDHPGPLARDLVEPMRRCLSMETRRAILEIKEHLLTAPDPPPASIRIYQAVLDGGVRTPEEFRRWMIDHPAAGLTNWRPGQAAD